MKITAVEFYAENAMKLEIERLKGHISTEQMLNKLSTLLIEAKKIENELLLHVIKCYHNNLFFVPLNENGEAEAILELILSGQIKSKLDI